MNVLFFCNNLNPSSGGVERVTSLLAKFFLSHNIKCYYAYCGDDDETVDDSLKLRYKESDDYNNFKAMLSDFLFQKQIDVIINQDQMQDNTARFMGELKTNSSIATVNCMHINPKFYHYSPLYQSIKWKIKNKLHKLYRGYTLPLINRRSMYYNVDQFVLLSDSFIDDFAYEIGVKKTDLRAVAIPNPLSFKLSPLSLCKKKNQFLIVARFEESQKNLCSAMRIWKRFEERNDDYELIVAGYGPDLNMVLNYAQSLQIKQMRFIGKVQHPEELYKEAKFFLMTSTYEGLSMTLLECMQFGCIPIVYDSFSSVHDFIKSWENGVLVKFGQEKEFVDAMIKLVSDNNLQEQISKCSYEQSQNYSIEKVGNKWIEFLNKITNGK